MGWWREGKSDRWMDSDLYTSANKSCPLLCEIPVYSHPSLIVLSVASWLSRYPIMTCGPCSNISPVHPTPNTSPVKGSITWHKISFKTPAQSTNYKWQKCDYLLIVIKYCCTLQFIQIFLKTFLKTTKCYARGYKWFDCSMFLELLLMEIIVVLKT